jgi:DNA gyrase inhibitor GyrI
VRGATSTAGPTTGTRASASRTTTPTAPKRATAATTPASFRAESEIGVQTLPGGLYACTPFHGTPETIRAAWQRLFSEWLPASAYQADDRPSFEASGTEIAGDPPTGAFACQLCVAVRAL